MIPFKMPFNRICERMRWLEFPANSKESDRRRSSVNRVHQPQYREYSTLSNPNI
jgi:hypothetical protein